MSNRFDIAVTATDKFSVTFASLNSAIEKATKPLNEAGRRGSKAFDSTPARKYTQTLWGVTGAFDKLATSFGGLSAPAQALLGLGTAGGVVAALAGVAAFSARYSDMGTTVLRTSQRLAIGTDELQTWRAAAKAAGFETEIVDENFKSLAQTLQDARFGRNIPARDTLTHMIGGISLKNGVVDVVGNMEKIIRAVERLQDPNARETFAKVLGLSPEFVQFATLGMKRIQEGIDRAREAGSAQSSEALKDALAQKQAIGELGNAWDQFALKLGSLVAPPLTVLIDSMTSLLGPGHMLKHPVPSSTPPAALSARTPEQIAEMPAYLREMYGVRGGSSRGQKSPQAAADPLIEAYEAYRAETDPQKRNLAADQFLAAARQAQPSVVEVHVNVANAPAGTTVAARSSGGGVPVRVSRSAASMGTP